VQSAEVHVELEQNWEAGLIPGDQGVEAMLVAKLAGSRGPGTPANRSSEQVLAVGEIQSWPASSLWCTSKYKNMSETCARARRRRGCRGGRSMLTVSGGEIGIPWRRDGSVLCSLAVMARVLGGEIGAERAVYMEGWCGRGGRVSLNRIGEEFGRITSGTRAVFISFCWMG
jgi:hypothetical protein